VWVLAAVAFVLCIAQLGPFLVLAPAVGWLYWQGAAGTATGLLVWTVIVGTLDNVVRPILMTKGTGLPMVLMFAGAPTTSGKSPIVATVSIPAWITAGCVPGVQKAL
jgi:predicted PurR-regulated permease PerM